MGGHATEYGKVGPSKRHRAVCEEKMGILNSIHQPMAGCFFLRVLFPHLRVTIII